MNMIVAADREWGIGRDNGLLAHLPGDMRYFKEKTSGKVVLMGRKTLESLPGRRGLPNRINYVLTGQKGYSAERCTVVNSEEELFREIEGYDPDDVMLIGGASLYNRFYRLCTRLYVTRMDAVLGADTFIADLDKDPDYEIESLSGPFTENGVTYRFAVYVRKDRKAGKI